MAHISGASVIFGIIITIVMLSSLYYLYYHEKLNFLFFFSSAFLLNFFGFIARLFSPSISSVLLPEFIFYTANLLSGGLLVLGGRSLSTAIKKQYIIYFIVVYGILISVFFLSGINSQIKNSIIFLVAGSCYLYIGIQFLRDFRKNRMYFILAIYFILWGLLKYSTSLFSYSVWFDRGGYLIDLIFLIATILCIIFLYYQSAKKDIQSDREQLNALIDIIKIDDVELLLDKALEIAIKVTKSKYGYIFRYSEQFEEFKLSTWSTGVHADCEVIEPQSIYQLAKTGCWGEAVRQRKPFILNDYESEKKYKKGIPAGHVEIRKFLTVPFFAESEIVAVIGVANKRDNYNEDDSRNLSLLMNTVWTMVEVKEYQKQLEMARNQAEESNTIKSTFLANISHELRTPLNGTLGMLSLLKECNEPEKAAMYLNMAYKSSENMLYLVEDVLRFSKYSNRTLEPEIAAFDLIGDIRTIIELNRPEAEASGIMIDLLCELTELRIKSDKIKLNQILVNLINNAIKFSEHGKIIITVKRADKIIISIQDHGIGIPKNKLELIFEPFYQLEDPYTKTHKGIGAGLAIVKSLCDLLNIGIEVESELRVGTKVILKIPY